MSPRPDLWRSAFARRTAASGALWTLGVLAAALRGAPGSTWPSLRTDPAGLLLTAAALFGGLNFASAGIRAARRLQLDMNFLMTAALLGALALGEPFEAATLAFLFSTAELLERYAVERGRRSITALLELAPDNAERVRPDGTGVTVPVADLRPGDVVRVRPGGRIPADGRVIAGASAVNEATITGEAVPRSKSEGDGVFAGTVNADGALDIAVSVDAEHSTLARIVKLVRDAEARRAPVEHAVRRFARIYTPIVVGIAIVVMLLPPLLGGGAAAEWFRRGLALLVIACPCALVIATPVTVVSALTSAARRGILIKGGEYLETLGAVRTLCVDKTGTLTTGELVVASFMVNPGASADRLLRVAAAVESRSQHPVAAAVVRYAERSNVGGGSEDVTGFASVPGQGVRAMVDGLEVRVGTAAYAGLGVADSPTAVSARARVYLAAGTEGTGTFDLTDALRPAAPAAIAALHALGIAPIVMLSGDEEHVARSIAGMVGIDDVRAGLLPEEKVAAVQALRMSHGAVAMLGDGVNDAPALAAADLGIAMGAAGSAAALEAADVALMGDDLAQLPVAVDLARRARRVIRFNIALAIGLKLVLAVGAVTGVVNLAVAVLVGDMGGTLAVTLNALRLGRLPVRVSTLPRRGATK